MNRTILGTMCIACLAFGQTADTPPKFDAADVHVAAKTQFPNVRVGGVHGGRYEIKSATMVDLIHTAYSMDNDKILGGPSWLELYRFDVTAKVPAGTAPDAIPVMLQTLLADRFKLVVHKESKPLPAYALVAGKKPQIKEAAGTEDSGCKISSDAPVGGGGPEGGGMRLMMTGTAGGGASGAQTLMLGPGMTLTYNCRNMTMAAFASGLPKMMGASLGTNPVIEDTGLKGGWNFDVRWSMSLNGLMLPGQNADRISIFEAMEKQLGLKLEERQVPTPVLMVDTAIEKPTDNPPNTAEVLPPIPAPKEFDVASVKPADPGGRMMMSQFQPGGKWNVQGMPLHQLLNQAFLVTTGDQLVGVPAWADTERFDVNAKMGSDGTASPIDRETAAPLIRALLADRFKLTYHTEERPVTAYSLVGAKPKLKKADPSSRTFCKSSNAPAGSPPGTRLLTCQNTTMAQFAEQLKGMGPELAWPVLDTTGLEGGWDFTLLSSGGMMMATTFRSGGGGDMAMGGGGGGASDPNGGQTIFEAIEKQLGLKLEKQKRSEPVYVIDHLEQKPTDN